MDGFETDDAASDFLSCDEDEGDPGLDSDIGSDVDGDEIFLGGGGGAAASDSDEESRL